MPNLNDCLSVAQAAEKTGIPRRSLLAAITRGELKATKVAPAATSAYLIETADLAEYLQERSA